MKIGITTITNSNIILLIIIIIASVIILGRIEISDTINRELIKIADDNVLILESLNRSETILQILENDILPTIRDRGLHEEDKEIILSYLDRIEDQIENITMGYIK